MAQTETQAQTQAQAKEQVQEAVKPTAWWVYLVTGILSIIIGWLLVVHPVKTVFNLVVLLGLYWFISGIVGVIFALFDIGEKGSKWGWELFVGIISIIGGLLVLNNQVLAAVVTPVFFTYLVIFLFIINGIVQMIAGKQNRLTGEYDWSWGNFFLGLFYFGFGVILLLSPLIVSTASLVLAAGILAIAGGIMSIIFAFKVKD